jgi:hypothetical protein
MTDSRLLSLPIPAGSVEEAEPKKPPCHREDRVMSIVEPDRPGTRKFLTVACPCGRNLRAPKEMAGQEISCWECRRMVRVPIPRSSERAFRVIVDGLGEVLQVPWLVVLCLTAAALTGVLCVPGIGVPIATAILVLCGLGYGELIRQCGIDVWDFDDWKRPLWLLQRLGVGLLFGLAITAPLLFNPSGWDRAPRFTTLGVILEVAAAIVIPVLIFLIFARDEDQPLGWRRGAALLLRYPVASALALLLLPIGVVLSEMAMIGMSSWQGMFPFVNLDLYPGAEYFAERYKIPKYGNYTREVLPDARFFHLYFRRLHQGFALTTSVPASLSYKTFVLGSPWTLDLSDEGYLRIRAMYTWVSLLIIGFFLALQARWLGAIATLDSKRSIQDGY